MIIMILVTLVIVIIAVTLSVTTAHEFVTKKDIVKAVMGRFLMNEYYDPFNKIISLRNDIRVIDEHMAQHYQESQEAPRHEQESIELAYHLLDGIEQIIFNISDEKKSLDIIEKFKTNTHKTTVYVVLETIVIDENQSLTEVAGIYYDKNKAKEKSPSKAQIVKLFVQ